MCFYVAVHGKDPLAVGKKNVVSFTGCPLKLNSPSCLCFVCLLVVLQALVGSTADSTALAVALALLGKAT